MKRLEHPKTTWQQATGFLSPLLLLALALLWPAPQRAHQLLAQQGSRQDVSMPLGGTSSPGSGAGPTSVTSLAPAPIAMSNPDGQDLILEDLSVKAAVQGMLAFTELEMRFRNPQPRRMEGRFSCTLPTGAAISRFAKEVNGQLMEGEVVERLRANKIYDTILHEMRDPALLEQDQGNRFSAKVFPIEANSTVRLVLSYSRLLPLEDGVRTYSLPLRGLPTMAQFSFRGLFSPLPGEQAEAASGLEGPKGSRNATVQVMELKEVSYTPTTDLEVRWRPEKASPDVRVLTSGDFFLTSFRLPAAAASSERASRGGSWVFYVDTSASSAEGRAHRLIALERLLGGLPAGDKVEVKAFDQEIVSIASGRGAELAASVRSRLEARPFLGGTRLDAVVTELTEIAKKSPSSRFVVVTDGVATLGLTRPEELTPLFKAIPEGTQVHALVLGARQDEATLKALTQSHGRIVTVPFTERIEELAGEAARKLVLPLGIAVSIKDEGATWVFPETLHDLQPGAEVIVLGQAKAGRQPETRLEAEGKVLLQAKGAAPLPSGTFAPLLEREAYRTYLEYLAWREANETNPAVQKALATEQVQVSIAHRVLIPRTTLLVLESEADYQRFGLERQALASILTVGAGGIERLDRSRPAPVTPVVNKPTPTPVPVTQAAEERPEPRPRNGHSPSARPVAADDDDEDLPVAMKMMAEEASGLEGEVGLAEVSSEVLGSMEMDDSSMDEGRASGGSMAASGRASAPSRRTVSLGSGAGAAAAPPPAPSVAPSSSSSSGRRDSMSSGSVPVTGEVSPRYTPPGWVTPDVPTNSAVAALKKAVTENPRDRSNYNQLADAYFARAEWKELRTLALEWQPYDPENPQVYESLGEASLSLGDQAEASRAFGSLVEIAPANVELLQRAGLLLLRTGSSVLAEAPLRKALETRPDRVNGYRHLALMLWQQGRMEEAAVVLESARQKTFPSWYKDAQRIVSEELGYIYRSWIALEPAKADAIKARAAEQGVDLARKDALRVTLAWETDANDVDLHVVDPNGEVCYYSHRSTAMGLELYEDITQGLGPEVVRAERVVSGKYSIGVNYFSAGPMGVSRGVLIVMLPKPDGTVSSIKILPFRLVQGGADMRLLATLNLEGAKVTK